MILCGINQGNRGNKCKTNSFVMTYVRNFVTVGITLKYCINISCFCYFRQCNVTNPRTPSGG